MTSDSASVNETQNIAILEQNVSTRTAVVNSTGVSKTQQQINVINGNTARRMNGKNELRKVSFSGNNEIREISFVVLPDTPESKSNTNSKPRSK